MNAQKTVLAILFIICTCYYGLSQERERWMDNKRMHTIFETHIEQVEGEFGTWKLHHQEQILFVLCDTTNNRMRMFTPVIEESKLKGGELEAMLTANFHSALDAKYSLYEGFVISVYTHPLKELTEAQLLSAMEQVINLADNFGYTYSSTNLFYGNPTEEVKKLEVQKPLKRS